MIHHTRWSFSFKSNIKRASTTSITYIESTTVSLHRAQKFLEQPKRVPDSPASDWMIGSHIRLLFSKPGNYGA